MMMVVVTFVSLMVHIYTMGYMKGDAGYRRFFSYISLFTFSMLMLVMSNNFINHLLAVNEMLCNQHDISANVLRPLIDQTFEKARNGSPLAAQTGPAIRNDSGTIDRHMAMLADVSEIANMYLTITNSIKKLHNKS